MAGKSKTVVHVVLDTNALFTEVADKLISEALSELIIGTKDNLDLEVYWYLPWIVKAERQFQMTDRANRLLPQLQKIERLLGHQLGITEDVLRTRVDEAIKRQLDHHELKEINFDPAQVEWQSMVERSIFRRPPFERGQTEKGFRDAILLEIFCQLSAALPKTPQICRIVLLSGDGLLAIAARERTSERNNIVIISDLESLKTMLNALAAELTQEMVAALLPKAASIFFEVKDENTLYYKAAIQQKTREQFRAVISAPPAPDFSVNIKAITISSKLHFSPRPVKVYNFPIDLFSRWKQRGECSDQCSR